MQYNYNQRTGEFEENPSGIEEGDVTGNRVRVFGFGSNCRFQVQVDDFADKLAALNRLVRKFIPTFNPF